MILLFLLIVMAIPVLYLIPCDVPKKEEEEKENIEAMAKADCIIKAAPWNR